MKARNSAVALFWGVAATNPTKEAALSLVFWSGLRYQIDMTDNSLDDLARKLAESVPEGLRSMQADLEKNFGSVLREGLVKLDLVTREEFDVQEAVLARTREKLEALEQRLEKFERKKK